MACATEAAHERLAAWRGGAIVICRGRGRLDGEMLHHVPERVARAAALDAGLVAIPVPVPAPVSAGIPAAVGRAPRRDLGVKLLVRAAVRLMCHREGALLRSCSRRRRNLCSSLDLRQRIWR